MPTPATNPTPDGEGGPWKWAVYAAFLLKALNKVWQVWKWRDAAERRLREEMSGMINRLSVEIGALRQTNERQQAEINALRAELASERQLKVAAMEKVNALEAEIDQLRTTVGGQGAART